MSATDPPDFSCQTESSGSVLRARFSGVGDMETASLLDAALRQIKGQLATLTYVELDVTGLYFLNSSCLKDFGELVIAAASQPNPCQIVFKTDPKLGWQGRALAVLERLGRGRVSIR